MSHHHQLNRLQHKIHSHLHLSSHHSPLPTNEATRESIQHFPISTSNNTKLSRPFRPGPHQARRGGVSTRDRSGRPFKSLPKRAIYYDLAESFMDHSTNPLSSDLYKIRFKHSRKQWPNGRFINYKAKLEQIDGNSIHITCTRTFPIVQTRKKMDETQQNEFISISSASLSDPVAHEQKKKQADKQTNIYADLFGCEKTSRFLSNTQIKKTNCTVNSTASSTSISFLGENKEDHQC